MKIKFLGFCVLSFLLGFSHVNVKAGDVVEGKLPDVTLSAGLLFYKGDLAFINEVGHVYNPTMGYELNIGYTLWKTLGIELYGMYGTLSQEQRTLNILHNFRTTMVSGGINLIYRFNNDHLLSSQSKIAPFIVAGFSPFAYFPYGDFQDGNGNLYYYWSDGSIRNIDEQAANARDAIEVNKDFDYELSYRGVGSFPVMAFSWNVGIGTRFEVTSWLSAQLKGTYSFTSTDFLDGFQVNGSSKDGYLYANLGLVINPNKLKGLFKKDEGEEVADYDVDEFLSMDSDGDGVIDFKDKCPNTESGVKVDGDGCVQNEKEDKKDLLSMFSDSLIVLRSQICANYPALCYSDETEYIKLDGTTDLSKYKKKDKQKKLEEQVSMSKIIQMADKDKDGTVELPELYEAIEQFFDEKSKMTLPELRKLIDYFFEQF